MKQTFFSRVDLWYYLVPLIFIYPMYETITTGDWQTTLVVVLTLCLVLSMLYCTYSVDGQSLRVQCGPFPYPKMKIQDIVSIRKTRSMWSAPALSLDRIAVTSRNGRILVISPKDRVAFIQAILAINPDIKVDEDCLLRY